MRKYMYVRSTSTGQVYMTEFYPKYGGYELASREEYVKWCEEHRIKPEKES